MIPNAVLPSRRFRRRTGVAFSAAAAVTAILVYLKIDPMAILRDLHYVTSLIGEMIPPNLQLYWTKPGLWASLIQTVAIAFLATTTGAVIALTLSLLAASNTTPSPLIRLFVRTLLTAERCTPNLVTLLVLLIAVGIGPFAAMLALLIGSVGMFGKLFADAIENVDPLPAEAIAAVGASRLQIIRYAILPQSAPAIVANVFYAFDVNLRMAVTLGVFGGGGIGFELHVARSVLRYRDMCAYVILILIMITLMERLADSLRARLFAD